MVAFQTGVCDSHRHLFVVSDLCETHFSNHCGNMARWFKVVRDCTFVKVPSRVGTFEGTFEGGRQPLKVPSKGAFKTPSKVPSKGWNPLKVPSKVPLKVPSKVPLKVPSKVSVLRKYL